MHDTEATTTTSRRDSSDDVAECRKPLHVVVDGAVLFDVGVGLRDVRLGLVIVVVRHEVLDRVVRQHLPQLVGQLGGQRLVGRHHQGGSLQPLDEPRGGRRLPGTGGAEQHHVALSRSDPPLQLVDGGRLVTGRSMRADHLEPAAGAHDLINGAVFRMRDYGMLGGEGHDTRVERCTDKCLCAADMAPPVNTDMSATGVRLPPVERRRCRAGARRCGGPRCNGDPR